MTYTPEINPNYRGYDKYNISCNGITFKIGLDF